MKIPHEKFLQYLEGVDMPASVAKTSGKKKEKKMTALKSAVEIYWKWLCKNYTNENRRLTWCPAPGCEYCVIKNEYAVVIDPVECYCGKVFCLKCCLTGHLPVECDDAKAWETKNSSESDNMSYILLNTKECPGNNCGKRTERSQGCNHMTCN
jgi:ariadne-1